MYIYALPIAILIYLAIGSAIATYLWFNDPVTIGDACIVAFFWLPAGLSIVFRDYLIPRAKVFFNKKRKRFPQEH
jgi:hypothetical protein